MSMTQKIVIAGVIVLLILVTQSFLGSNSSTERTERDANVALELTDTIFPNSASYPNDWAQYNDQRASVTFFHPALWECDVVGAHIVCMEGGQVTFTGYRSGGTDGSYDGASWAVTESTQVGNLTKQIVKNSNDSRAIVKYSFNLGDTTALAVFSFEGVLGNEVYYKTKEEAEQIGDLLVASVRER